jgi:hypothetical protein
MYYLSVWDLLLLEGFAEAFGSEDKEKIEEYLYENGLDVNKYYEEEVVLHRCLSQKEPVECVRYLGAERSDKSWLNTGVASTRAWIDNTKDDMMKEDMKNMSREGNTCGYTNQYDSDNY